MKAPSFLVRCLTIVFLSSTSYAQGNAPVYTCGSSPASKNNTQWCQCYTTYMEKFCDQQEGGTLCHDIPAMRAMIDSFGGAKQVCSFAPMGGIDEQQCISTLGYWMANCPVQS